MLGQQFLFYCTVYILIFKCKRRKKLKFNLKICNMLPSRLATRDKLCSRWGVEGQVKPSQAKLLQTILCINPEVTKNCLFMRPPQRLMCHDFFLFGCQFIDFQSSTLPTWSPSSLRDLPKFRIFSQSNFLEKIQIQAVLWIRIRMDPELLSGSGSGSVIMVPDPDPAKSERAF